MVGDTYLFPPRKVKTTTAASDWLAWGRGERGRGADSWDERRCWLSRPLRFTMRQGPLTMHSFFYSVTRAGSEQKKLKPRRKKEKKRKKKKSLTCSLHLFTMREFYCWTDKRKEVEGLVGNESPDLICISAILMRRMSPAWQCPDLVPKTVSGGWGRLEDGGRMGTSSIRTIC